MSTFALIEKYPDAEVVNFYRNMNQLTYANPNNDCGLGNVVSVLQALRIAGTKTVKFDGCEYEKRILNGNLIIVRYNAYHNTVFITTFYRHDHSAIQNSNNISMAKYLKPTYDVDDFNPQPFVKKW